VTFFVDFGVKSAVVLGIAFLVALIVRRGSASFRYVLWICALAAVLLLPLLSRVGPTWNIDRSAWRRATTDSHVIEEALPGISIVVDGARTKPGLPWPMVIWIAGAVAMFARVGAGHWRVRSLYGKAEKIRDGRWLRLVEETALHIGYQRAVVVKRSTATDVPLSYGLIRATVLLPGESEHWTEERSRIVLAHEMIHARRLDAVWGLVAQCSLAVNWFNPLAWLAVRRFRREQERSCDDAVVAAGTASTIYAAHLVDLARSIAIPEPALGMAERFDLEGRVHALLDSSRRRKAASARVCAVMFAVAVGLALPLAAIRAQSISRPPAIDVTVAPVAQTAEVPKNEIALVVSKPSRRTPVREHSAPVEEPQAGSAISGSVYDPSGAVIPGARITLKSTGSSNEEAALADTAGNYKLQAIPAGEYVLNVRSPGFAVYQRTLSLEGGSPATVNVHLAIGEVTQDVFITATRPEGGAPANSGPQRIRVGGMVQAVNLMRKVNPLYPPDARAEGVEGTVLLRAIISKAGSLLSIVPVSSAVDPRLVSAAIAAVSQWQDQPTLLNNEPVEVITTITVSFRLN
jgi:TonB family protein